MIQYDLFGEEIKENIKDGEYTSKVKNLIYEIKGVKPHLIELCDRTKSNIMISEIQQSSVSEEQKKFLIEAAKRFTVFNYENIAEYYAHAEPEMQKLMERSALVIIDFEKAIEYGFVNLANGVDQEIMKAVKDLSLKYKMSFYNYPKSKGLGILIRE